MSFADQSVSWLLILGATLYPAFAEEQCCRSGESVHLAPMWPGFDSGPYQMWIEFDICFRLAPRVFFSEFPGFPPSWKSNISKFQFLSFIYFKG